MSRTIDWEESADATVKNLIATHGPWLFDEFEKTYERMRENAKEFTKRPRDNMTDGRIAVVSDYVLTFDIEDADTIFVYSVKHVRQK